MSQRPPSLQALLAQTRGPRPVAFVLAGHHGSGKSTLWYTRLADSLQIPLVNADRMMMTSGGKSFRRIQQQVAVGAQDVALELP